MNRPIRHFTKPGTFGKCLSAQSFKAILCALETSDRARIAGWEKLELLRLDWITNKEKSDVFLPIFGSNFRGSEGANAQHEDKLVWNWRVFDQRSARVCVRYQITNLHLQLQATNLGKPRAVSWIHMYRYCLWFGIYVGILLTCGPYRDMQYDAIHPPMHAFFTIIKLQTCNFHR